MSGQGKLPLSMAIVTLNEGRLGDCLASVSATAEIVVDSGSSDGALETAA